MERFTSYEIFSSALVWLCTSLLRLAADVMRRREAAKGKEHYRPSGWRVLFHLTATATVAFLTTQYLHEGTWGNGKRMAVLFLATFLAPAAIDALLLVNGKMLLAEFAKWLSSKTQNAVSLSEPEPQQEQDRISPPSNQSGDDTPTNNA